MEEDEVDVEEPFAAGAEGGSQGSGDEESDAEDEDNGDMLDKDSDSC